MIGEVFGLLANTINFEFAELWYIFFAKIFHLWTHHRLSGPDSTLRTAVSAGAKHTVQCLRELRANLDEVFTSAVQLANENGTESEFPIRRRRKVSR